MPQRPCHELIRPPEAGLSAASAEPLRSLARAHRRSRGAPFVSRSYAPPLALIAWHTKPIGVDLERVGASDRAFAESICTPTELRLFADSLDDARFVTSLWSSKEALAKALGDALAYDPRRLQSPLGWSDGRAGSWSASELHVASGHVAWLVWSLEERPDRPSQSY